MTSTTGTTGSDRRAARGAELGIGEQPATAQVGREVEHAGVEHLLSDPAPFVRARIAGALEYQPSMAQEPLTLAMKFAAMPAWMVGVVAFGSVVAHTAVLLVFQLGQPRIFFSMARDGLLPPVFAKVHPKFRTPHVVTAVTGVGVMLAAAFLPVGKLADYSNSGTLFAFAMVAVAGIAFGWYTAQRRLRDVQALRRPAEAVHRRWVSDRRQRFRHRRIVRALIR